MSNTHISENKLHNSQYCGKRKKKKLNQFELIALHWDVGEVYWGLGGRPLAAATLEPHSSSSLLVSSLWAITSMKHKQSFLGPVAVSIASISSSSQWTWKQIKYKRIILSKPFPCFGIHWLKFRHHVKELTLAVQHLPSPLCIALTNPV